LAGTSCSSPEPPTVLLLATCGFANEAMYLPTGSSSVILPSSKRSIAATVVMGLLME
jgi:hypothetical protein